MVSISKFGINADSWFTRNSAAYTRAVEIIFGIVWLIDGQLKFAPGLPAVFSSMVASAAQGQPQWLHGWFAFWSSVSMANPQFFVYFVGLCELALGFALVFGFMRKTAFTLGAVLSLLIWAVPEGFGGPYGPSSTDIGTGIIYAILLLMLLGYSAMFMNSRYTLDSVIRRRVKWWSTFSDFRRK